MALHVLACLLFFVATSSQGYAEEAEKQTPPVQIAQVERREQLLKFLAIARDDYYSREVEELACMARQDAGAHKALLKLAIAHAKLDEKSTEEGDSDIGVLGSMSTPYWMVEHLAAGGEAVTPDLLAALQSEKALKSRSLSVLLIGSLARMRTRDQRVLRYMRDKLANSQDPPMAACLRVALATLGDHSPARLAEIRTDLAREKTCYAAAQMMVHVRANEWIDKEMLQALIQSFKERGNYSALVQLGMLGSKAISFADALSRDFRTAVEKGDGGALILGLTLASIDDKRRNSVLQTLSQNLDKMGDCHFGWLILAAATNVHKLTGPLGKDLMKLVRDPDRRVARHALSLIQCAGLSSRDIAPDVIAFVQGTSNDNLRADAAYTLDAIADYSSLIAMEAALKKEPSPKVRKNLSAAIKHIRTLDNGVFYGPPEFMYEP